MIVLQHHLSYNKVGATISKITAMLLSSEETSKILCTIDLVYKFAFVFQEVTLSNKV